jgi:TRAP transporter TAXI family solute receptor
MRKMIQALSFLVALQAGIAFAGVPFKIATADPRGTYYAIGNDLASMVAPQADIDLEVMPTDGSAANIKLLRFEPGVKYAIVQADVYQAFVDRGSAAASAEAARIIKPLRVILPLYNTEIHFIVRTDSEMNFLHDMKNAKINGGLVGSGAAFITATLYRNMFGGPMPENQQSYLSNAEALGKLVTDKSVDVVVVAAGQPAPIISGMKPEAQKLIKFLKFDPKHPSSQSSLKVYAPQVLRKASYPQLLTEDFTTVAVGAFLVTYDYNLQATVDSMAKFARSLCQNFATLQEKGHPKWKEVSLALPELNTGWSYYGPTSRELRQCIAANARASSRPAARPSNKDCAPEERILGLCS